MNRTADSPCVPETRIEVKIRVVEIETQSCEWPQKLPGSAYQTTRGYLLLGLFSRSDSG